MSARTFWVQARDVRRGDRIFVDDLDEWRTVLATHLIDSGPAIAKSSGHFAPRLYNGAAGDPFASVLQPTTGRTYFFSTEPAPIEPAQSASEFLPRHDHVRIRRTDV